MAASSTGGGKASCHLLLYLPLSLNSSYNLHHRYACAKEGVACFIFYTVVDKLAAAVHTPANIQLHFSLHLFAGLLSFRVCSGSCSTVVL